MADDDRNYLDRMTYRPGDLKLVKRGTGPPLSETPPLTDDDEASEATIKPSKGLPSSLPRQPAKSHDETSPGQRSIRPAGERFRLVYAPKLGAVSQQQAPLAASERLNRLFDGAKLLVEPAKALLIGGPIQP
jgi:hypothetical protein